MPIVARLRALFQRFVLQRAWTAFIALGLSFLGFGIGTISIATLLKANLDLVIEFGWQALQDGAARQLAELLLNGYASMAFYVVFKACEYRLVHGISDPP
jgi:hypothetical protein